MKVDWLFKNVTVIDGSGGPQYRGDVAGEGDRIVDIAPALTGAAGRGSEGGGGAADAPAAPSGPPAACARAIRSASVAAATRDTALQRKCRRSMAISPLFIRPYCVLAFSAFSSTLTP